MPLLSDAFSRLFPPRAGDADAGAQEEKASRTGPLIAFHMAGQPVWTPRNYADLAREGFTKNAVVYRCVRMIAEAASSVVFQGFENSDAVDGHPLLELIARPNATQCAPDLFEAWYGYLMAALGLGALRNGVAKSQ